jgi:hypothetical protein
MSTPEPAVDAADFTDAEKPGPSCPSCGHLVGLHSHDVGCMDSMTDGLLERNVLGFCPCMESSLQLIVDALAQAWDDSAEATADWMAHNPGPSGIPADPPRNPYDGAL